MRRKISYPAGKTWRPKSQSESTSTCCHELCEKSNDVDSTYASVSSISKAPVDTRAPGALVVC
jgi:hypothetical protein